MPAKPDLETMIKGMASAGAGAFKDAWPQIERFAIVEFRTIAERMRAIGEGVMRGDFDVPTGKLLMQMQVNNAAAAIAGATTLTLVAAQKGMEAVVGAVADQATAVLGFALKKVV